MRSRLEGKKSSDYLFRTVQRPKQKRRTERRVGGYITRYRLVVAVFAITSFGFPTLAQGARITGNVRDSKGMAVVGAEVKVQGRSYSVTTTTDSEGNFAFNTVSATDAQIVVTARGMERFERHWDQLSAMPGNLTMYPHIVLRPKRGPCVGEPTHIVSPWRG
ncbi:MAG TPA: carboxypeptidase-like regulatory domain-containing protein [Candidatus Acidoferrales bacterium]|nr:carboxypeptidase-like regulatory domain-containing protein [Candidatus Acidoferrales bacterium]